MGTSSADKICRLCLAGGDLLWTFDIRCPGNNMSHVIYMATGVQISRNDEISQYVCSKCSKITIKMYEYRENSMTNNALLLDKLQKKKELHISKSVQRLKELYPNIMLPKSIMNVNLQPYVKLDQAIVPNWISAYKKKRKSEKAKRKQDKLENLRREKIERHTQLEKERLENLKRDSKQPEQNAGTFVDKVPEIIRQQNRHGSSETLETKKRKSVEIPEIPPKVAKISENSFMETLDLMPKASESVDALVAPLGNRALFICQECNSVQYSPKDLKMHIKKHFTCPLCRKHFRTMEETKLHVKDNNCEVRKVMNEVAKINKTGVEDIPTFTPSSTVVSSSKATKSIGPKAITQANVLCIPDAEPAGENNSLSKNVALNISTNSTLNSVPVITTVKTVELTKNVSVVSPNVKEMAPPPETANNNYVTASSIIQPSIEIIGGGTLLNNITNNKYNTELLKELLKNEIFLHNMTQTDYPTSADVLDATAIKDALFELPGLKKQLLFYKIPVNINGNSTHTLRFKSAEKIATKKNPVMWNNFVKMDLKNNNLQRVFNLEPKQPTAVNSSSSNDAKNSSSEDANRVMPPLTLLDKPRNVDIPSKSKINNFTCPTTLQLKEVSSNTHIEADSINSDRSYPALASTALKALVQNRVNSIIMPIYNQQQTGTALPSTIPTISIPNTQNYIPSANTVTSKFAQNGQSNKNVNGLNLRQYRPIGRSTTAVTTNNPTTTSSNFVILNHSIGAGSQVYNTIAPQKKQLVGAMRSTSALYERPPVITAVITKETQPKNSLILNGNFAPTSSVEQPNSFGLRDLLQNSASSTPRNVSPNTLSDNSNAINYPTIRVKNMSELQ